MDQVIQVVTKLYPLVGFVTEVAITFSIQGHVNLRRTARVRLGVSQKNRVKTGKKTQNGW